MSIINVSFKTIRFKLVIPAGIADPIDQPHSFTEDTLSSRRRALQGRKKIRVYKKTNALLGFERGRR